MARPRETSDDEMLEAARACFLEHGPLTSTMVIAERLGVSQAALFKRFGTKEQLMLAALAPPARMPWLDRVEAGPDGREVREQLRELAHLILGYFQTMVPRLSVLRAAGVGVEQFLRLAETPPPVMGHRAVAGWLLRARERGLVGPCDASDVAHIFLGALHIRPFHQHIAGSFFSAEGNDTYVETLVRVLWRGLAPEAER
jgi:AcrR family transcriptional regulator